MADIDIANICYAVIDRQMEGHKETLLAGKCSDFAHYRYICGKLHGLQALDEEIRDAFRKRYDDEDE